MIDHVSTGNTTMLLHSVHDPPSILTFSYPRRRVITIHIITRIGWLVASYSADLDHLARSDRPRRVERIGATADL
jgi:hypothetical protein